MNKRTIYTLLLILGLILCLIYLNIQQAIQNTKRPTPSHEAPDSPQSTATEGRTASEAKHPKAPSDTQSAAATNAYSSTVNLSINAGETLVMGGYRRKDGKHEFTMLTPTMVTLDNGKPFMKLTTKVMAMDLGLAHKSGLNSLTTHYPTANDHAEAWTQEEVRSTMLSASMAEGIELMAAPSVTNALGKPFSLNVGGANGISEYSIEATISNNAKGGFSIQSRMARNSESQHESSKP